MAQTVPEEIPEEEPVPEDEILIINYEDQAQALEEQDQVPNFEVPLEETISKVSKSVSTSVKKLNSKRLGIFDKVKNVRKQQEGVDSIFEQKSHVEMKQKSRVEMEQKSRRSTSYNKDEVLSKSFSDKKSLA